MTTFTELLKEAKDGKKLVPRPINQDLQKHIDSLNKMFAENWSTLFDKDKDYELWSDYANHVYFGNDYQYILIVNKSTIDTIELAPVNWSSVKRFPYPLKTMYVIILKHLVKGKLADEFRKAVINSGLSVIFDEVQDLDYLIKAMNNVLGENTFVFNDNTIKFKNEIIKVDNLAKLLVTLKNLYLDEVNRFYPKEWVEDAKNKFKTLCNKYTISPNDYLLYPIIHNNSISWKVTPKNNSFKLDYYFSLNTWYTHKGMKNISKEEFYNSLGELEEIVRNVAIKEVNHIIADRIIRDTSKKIRELNLKLNDIEKEIDFNGNKINVVVKDGNLSLKYKDYSFQCSYYSPHGPKTYFDEEEKSLAKENWLDYKIKLRQVSDLFIDFLNS